jgi:RNA polymerase sigma factor (sigma-70 family)
MAAANLDTLMHRLRTMVAAGHYKELDDGVLLERFISLKDELAFRTLVRRHGPLVLAVGRRLLGAGADLDDLFQATFLVLARRAGSIRRQSSLAGWLYAVAYRLSRKLRKKLDRRRVHEQPQENLDTITETEPMASDPSARASMRELGAILDEEIQRLPTKYREPLVLCHLEGLSTAEAAKRLRCPVPTLKSRLTRGRELLRERLVRRGVTLSAAGVAVVFAEQACRAAAPLKLVHAAVHGAVAFAAKPVASAIVSAQAAALVKGMLKTATLTKLSVVLAALCTSAVLGFGATRVREQQVAETPPPDPGATLVPAAIRPPTPSIQPQQLRVVVLDPQGKPLADAKVHASIWTDDKNFKANRDYQTDTTGAAQVELPKTVQILRLWASKKGFARVFVNWDQGELASGGAIPPEYKIQLDSAVTAGGRIVDEQDKPVAGAKVHVSLANNLKPVKSDGRAQYDLSTETVTDIEGRWRIDGVPNHPEAKLSLQVSHPDFVIEELWGKNQQRAGVTTEKLIQGTANLTLNRGVIVRGRVTGPDDKPIKDAIVVLGDEPYISQLQTKFPTDADGQFRLPAQAPGETSLTVMAPGLAPQLRKVKLETGLAAQDFRMEPGKPIRLRIVDAAGMPVPKASVGIVGWKGSHSIRSLHNPNQPKAPDTKIPRQADAEGIWEWTAAPAEPVELNVHLQGYSPSKLEIAGGSPMQSVTLKAEFRVTGRVSDAVTGQPIPAFTVIPVDVFQKDSLIAERPHAEVGKNGRFSFLATRSDIPLRLRIEALGYRTQDGPEFHVGRDTPGPQDFRLQPSPAISGLVLDVNGQPLAKAKVRRATPTEGAELNDTLGQGGASFTDAAGRFQFPDPGEPCAVMVHTEAGFVQAEFPANRHDLGTLRLQPWALIKGRFHDGGKPIQGATIILSPIRLHGPDAPRIDLSMQTVTGADGSFQFPRVPPVPVKVQVVLGPWQEASFHSGPIVPLDLQPGQQADLQLGSGGAILNGKVALGGKVPPDLDCTYSINYLIRRAPGIVPPAEIAKLGFDIQNGWRYTWQRSTERLAYLSTLQHWFVKLAADGSFQVSGVPAGEYDLVIEVFAKPTGCLVDPLATKLLPVTVTAADVARGHLDLPLIPAKVIPIPSVGDTPALTFQRPDGTRGNLADFRGRYTIVHFWASWCTACKQQLPAFKQLSQQHSARGLATLGLSLDDDAKAWQAALPRWDVPWPQGRLATASESGVGAVPAYWLLDPAGKIVARVYDLEELGKALKDLP